MTPAFAASLLRRGRRLFSFVASARQARLLLTTAVFVVVAGSTRLLACPVCFGAEESSIIDATRLGVVVMLAFTLVVQGAFVGFFLYLRRRAKRNADTELDTEWSELQGAPRT